VVEGALITLIPDVGRASHWEAMDAADAVVFGCPTYMGSGSGRR
jgi:multimeric flavodoxin WrbA